MITTPSRATPLGEAHRTVPSAEDRPTVSVEEAANIMGIARSTAFLAARRGEIPTIAVGRRLLVPTARLRALLGLDERATVSESPGAAA